MTDDNLATALARVQAQLVPVGKDKKANAGQYSYTYADLASVQAAVLPLLAAEGLAWIARPTMQDERFVLAYTLAHGPSGEREDGHYPLPDPTRGTPQQIGSAITYARRYCLSAVVGVATEDDDGKAASDGAAPKAQSRRPKPEGSAADAALHDRELRKGGPKAERGALPTDADPFAVPEWAVTFRTLLSKAMTDEALGDRWADLQKAASDGLVSPEWAATLKGEISARKAHLADPDATPEAAA